MSATPEKTDWRQRVKEIGKPAFIREEMERLGFWPPDEETAQKYAETLATLKIRTEELSLLQKELGTLDAELAKTQDVEKVLAEIRRQRIERVRAAREVTRAERLQAQEEKRAQDKEWRKSTLPFLGREVSAGLHYEDGNAERLTQQGLPILTTAEEVAQAIGIETTELAWLTYHRGASLIDHYARFSIPKRNGGSRHLSAPKRRLRVAQQWLLTTILEKLSVHEAAMAFRPKRSIRDNALPHTGQRVVCKLDLKDFFPSIKFRRLKGLFQGFGYNEGVATLFALLATEAPRITVTLEGEKHHVALGDRQLPQGACTSPAITNILCRRLDARLVGAAKSLGFCYTRYADDLVFSSAKDDAPVGMLLTLVRGIIANEDFVVNEEKTRVMYARHRQAVTGLVVNTPPPHNDATPPEPRLSRADIRRFRAFLHQCETKGIPTMSQKIGKNALAYAAGYLSFLHGVNPALEQKIQSQFPWLSRWQHPESSSPENVVS